MDNNEENNEFNKMLSDIFGTNEFGEHEDNVPVEIEKTGDDVTDDYAVTRHNLELMLEKGMEAVTSATAVAKSSEHPRAYEALATIMKVTLELNTQLLDTQLKMKKLKEETGNNSGPKTLNQTAVFVGSTAELSKALKELKKQNKPESE